MEEKEITTYDVAQLFRKLSVIDKIKFLNNEQDYMFKSNKLQEFKLIELRYDYDANIEEVSVPQKCIFTGLPKDRKITYFCDREKLGESLVSECSTNESRIEAAKEVGILYYDEFVLNDKSSWDIKQMYDGKLEAHNDFKISDLHKNLI